MISSRLYATFLLICAYFIISSSFRVASNRIFITKSSTIASNKGFSRNPSYLAMSSDEKAIDDQTKRKINNVINSNKVVLFMKGNKLFPQCGFSNTAVRILDALGTAYETVNVLEDDKIRNGIKVYSSWPTIPQLYVNQEFVGGSDIMVELYQNGELANIIELANAN